QLLEADEQTKVEAEAAEHLGGEGEVVDRVLDPDEVGYLLGNAFERVELQRHRRAAGNVVDQQRQPRTRAKVDVVFGQAPLWRPDVVGRHDQQSIDPRLFRLFTQLHRLCV